MSITENGEALSGPMQDETLRGQRSSRNLQLVLTVLAIAAFYIAAVGLGNTQVSINSNNGTVAISDAMSNYAVNDASSTTVYNQMVTNGWVAKDLLEAIGSQNAAIIDNQIATARLIQGTNSLLTFGLGMVAVIGIRMMISVLANKRK